MHQQKPKSQKIQTNVKNENNNPENDNAIDAKTACCSMLVGTYFVVRERYLVAILPSLSRLLVFTSLITDRPHEGEANRAVGDI